MTEFVLMPNISGFDISYRGKRIIHHSETAPCIKIGRAELDVSSHGGFHDIKNNMIWQTPLPFVRLDENRIHLSANAEHTAGITLTLLDSHIKIDCTIQDANHFTISLAAEHDEQVWGCGEQFSHLNLRGRQYPLWVAEPGVGRDPNGKYADRMKHIPGAAGNYWTTYYPQPTYLSSRYYALHLPVSSYSIFDFSAPERHTLECCEIPEKIELFGSETFTGLVSELSERFGRQPQLPDWAIEGAIIGLKDGGSSFQRLDHIRAAGVVVTGLWCEDWAGIRQTDFGRRLFWDWRVNEARFPDLENQISNLRDSGVHFLAYINPYLAVDGTLFPEASAKGYLVKHPETGGPYITDFGGFECGHIDLTHPDAMHWVADELIGGEMLDIGISGWMADFAEYLPVDAILHNGQDAALAHNQWPVLWATTNKRAVESRGKTGQAMFFMRSGFTGIGAYCPLLWAGDQSVDFSRHDGIETTIRAALSSGLIGNAYHHSDIAGYTSLFGNTRSTCLQKRWAELAAFTPVMRTHEGNRPDENLQIDSSEDLLAHFAHMTRIHARLAPYIRALCETAEATGLPLQRPLFLHYPDDPVARAIETQYLFGPDLLVAPVLRENTFNWDLYLPEGQNWIHLWSGKNYPGGGWITIDAPFGAPPVFYPVGSRHSDMFEAVRFETLEPTHRVDKH